MRRPVARILILINLMTLAFPASLWAQVAEGADYRLGAGDVLQLNVLQQPALDRLLTIRPDGTAVIPPVGEVRMAGLTVREAEESITQKMRLFNREVVDVSLTVTEYNALHVDVLGAVTSPGTYTFDHQPTLWDAIRAAGGAADNAVLSMVRVVSPGEGGTTTAIHDISAVITGRGAAAPVLLPADATVVVPGGDEGVLSAVPPLDGVQVFGGVAAPGVYPLSEPTQLMSVLMLAGGPIDEGELGKVRWVHLRERGGYDASVIDLDVFLEQGDLTGNPLIHPGDTVQVPRRHPGFFRSVYPLLLATVTAAASVVLVVDRLQD